MNEPPDPKDSIAPAVRVVIVEDESWLRENLAEEIGRGPGLRCVNSYRTAEEALEGLAADRPDVVLMDINLPGMDGVECIRLLRGLMPEVRCLILTVYEESDKIFNSLLAGASGYLLKRTGTAQLIEAIQQVSDGGSPMSSSIARKVVAYFNELGEDQSETSALSPREQQVLELLARGAAYKVIADQLSLSIETIRMNVKHIYAKLHVHSRGEAAAKFMQQSRFRTGSSNLGRGKG
ncbi:MAG TPA: response regulator transcription factor [Candidatus Acidoferrales bacterium]|nr:response regulator transcription factor [Candidatus Acidoferrales bacterium]